MLVMASDSHVQYISEVPHQPQDRPEHVVSRVGTQRPSSYSVFVMTSLNGRKLQSGQAHTENPEATRGKKNIRVFEQPQTEQLTERVE